MRKMIIAALAGALVALAVGVLSGAGASSDDGTTTVETVETTTETVETPKPDNAGGVDISGPCDEAEHANDPRCAGTTTPPATGGDPVDDDAGEDVGDDDGPAPAPAPRVDNSGPGSMNSGPGSVNSGPGNAEDRGDDDNSGPGSGDDDDDDHSGPGHGGDDSGGDDDNSGPGSGDDD